MILLNRVGTTGHPLMLDLWPQHLGNGARVRSMTIADHPLRGLAGEILSLRKEGFSRRHIALLTETRVDQITILIQTPIKITPLAFDLHIGLIDVPYLAHFPFPLGPQLISQHRRKSFLPIPYRFMGKVKAA